MESQGGTRWLVREGTSQAGEVSIPLKRWFSARSDGQKKGWKACRLREVYITPGGRISPWNRMVRAVFVSNYQVLTGNGLYYLDVTSPPMAAMPYYKSG